MAADHVIREFFGRDVQNVQSAGVTGISDGMQQVRFAKSHASVQEEGVVCPCRFIRHRLTSRMSQPVARTDNVRVKCVARIERDVARFRFGGCYFNGRGGRFRVRVGIVLVRLGNNEADGDL
jgi:hypothetical protein